MTAELDETGPTRVAARPAAPGPAPAARSGDGRPEVAERAAAGPGGRAPVTASPPATASGFFRRHRLPLLLAVVAACLYAGSILYILYGRGQIT